MIEPAYTSDNVKVAYQLRWTLALFANRDLPPLERWPIGFQQATQRDGIRILNVKLSSPTCPQFLLSTKPGSAPFEIVRCIKGRLQNMLRLEGPAIFRRNFRLSSIGDARRDTVEDYVQLQLGHHPMADPHAHTLLERYQLHFREVDLSQPVNSAHGQYLTNLHLVFVHSGRWRSADRQRLDSTLRAVLGTAKKHALRVSRLSLLADHLHLVSSLPYQLSPERVALSLMNNIAYSVGMARMLMPSFYVGTIGEFDMHAVRSRSGAASTDPGSVESGRPDGWVREAAETYCCFTGSEAVGV